MKSETERSEDKGKNIAVIVVAACIIVLSFVFWTAWSIVGPYFFPPKWAADFKTGEKRQDEEGERLMRSAMMSAKRENVPVPIQVSMQFRLGDWLADQNRTKEAKKQYDSTAALAKSAKLDEWYFRSVRRSIWCEHFLFLENGGTPPDADLYEEAITFTDKKADPVLAADETRDGSACRRISQLVYCELANSEDGNAEPR